MYITLIHLLCIHKRISCVYTRDLLCMHNTLVRALGQGPKKSAVKGPGPAQRLFWVPGPWGPWPRACTRVMCMHKRSFVYTQMILLCIHNKCINVIYIIYPLFYMYIMFSIYNVLLLYCLFYCLLVHF